jgi:hypothetical protein
MTLSTGRLRWALALLAILASAALPFFASLREMELLLALLAGIGIGALFLFNQYLGFAALIVGSQLAPFEIGTGTQTGINPAVLMTFLLSGIWLLDALIIRRDFALIPSSTYLPLLGLVISACLSFLIGQLRWYPVSGAPLRAQLGGLSVFVLSALIYLVTAHQLKDLAWLERLCWIFLGVGAFYLAGYHYVYDVSPAAGRLLAPLFRQGAAGSLFWVWLMVIPYSQLLANDRLRPASRLLLGLLLAAVIHIRVIENRAWTSGWLPAVVGLLAVTVVRLRRSIVILGLLGLTLAALNADWIRQVILEENVYSFDTRLEAYRIIIEIAKISPVFGLGPANYYWYAPLLGILGYYVNFSSHNNYIDLFAQTGLLGLALYLWFFLAAALLALRMVDRARDGFLNAYVYACIGGIAGSLAAGFLGDWVLPFVYNIGLLGFRSSVFTWMFLGGLLAIQFRFSGGKNSPDPSGRAPEDGQEGAR